jgi:hypothetical protein
VRGADDDEPRPRAQTEGIRIVAPLDGVDALDIDQQMEVGILRQWQSRP